ncbi:glycoside hydrolase [Vibrio coralliilyticus]|uniref:glycosyl hydrolase family 18 protein n=1 Tax=Vibrio coralliilyticus TaxID=190893 RepID=UPI00156189E9|nr:glycosyl hydrolase family 18 protein [Vibrio coralliilyticus]NRF28135.1 glycoside hydrolase [Vibrio coralliilyticus]NRF82259.1 glycoside hydrolase [Vibrio coralliilyticus]
MFNNSKTVTALAVSSALLSGLAFATPPGKATISWGDYTYAMVEVDQSQVAYEKLLKAVHDEVDVEVSWDVWSGGQADIARILVDGKVKWAGSGSEKSATFKMSHGGRYKMVVELENDDGITRSDEKDLLIADTDGSHLDPLEVNWTENNVPHTNTSEKIVGTYFVEWGVYGRDYPMDKMPFMNTNRILYGFIPICGGDGINDSLKTIDGSFQALQNACAGREDFKVAIHDPWAAIQKPQKGVEEWSAPYKGNFGQMMAAKKANPDLKILPSIGGWTLSDPFFFMDDPAKRAVFVDSVREFLETWKFFDGVDIDYEFPGGGGANPNLGDKENDGQTYVTLLKELREMLDELGEKNNRHYELASAINVGEDKIAVVDYKEASQYLDNIYMMSYDFYGAWSNTDLNHQTALHESSLNPGNNYYGSKGVELLLAQGVDPNKLVLGAAAYGRGWTGVNGYQPGNPFTGEATGPIKGTWEDGVVDYRDIVNNRMGDGWTYGYDEQAVAPYMFNESTGDLITYDDPKSVRAKSQYAIANNLGGVFHWEMDADNGDLLNAMHEGLGHTDNAPIQDNRTPIAKAGADREVTGPITIELDGGSSFDPEGEELTYQWTQTKGETVATMGMDTATPELSLPLVDTDKEYTFTLNVVDPHGNSAFDTINIINKVEEVNQAPVVQLLPQTYVNEGETFTLTATATDPEHDALSYTWNVHSDFIVLGDVHSNAITLRAPNVFEDTDYDISLDVTDNHHNVSVQSTIVVADNSDAGSESSCEATDPDATYHPTWDAATIYTNETVSHQGLVYKAKWWTQGSEPSPSNEAWELVSDVDLPWDASTAYQGNEQVNHNGSRWQAKWWTQGGEPGIDSVWVNIGPASCG